MKNPDDAGDPASKDSTTTEQSVPFFPSLLSALTPDLTVEDDGPHLHLAEDGIHVHKSSEMDETLEDFTLRFAPRSFRRWSPFHVANSALGGIAYLADFAIGASIAISYGVPSAVIGVLLAALIIFVTALPLAYYACRYNIDLDLISRGSGFGYYGSVLTNVVYASFTFIFFALEGSMMAQSLELSLDIPLPVGYFLTTVIVIPLVLFGMKVLSKLQTWTSPIWLVLMVVPMVYLIANDPGSVSTFASYPGESGLYSSASLPLAMRAMGVCLSLMTQIAEQIDYLRFMPPRTSENSTQWWVACLVAGPGWVVFGATKQIIGMFIAVYLVTHLDTMNAIGASVATADQPVNQFLVVYQLMMPQGLALFIATCLVCLSQIKINVTNAYSGSLAWTNAVTRITGVYSRRSLLMIANLCIALLLMECNMFDFLNQILGFYANCAIAWITTVAVDIAINKYALGISPAYPEFRRGMLFDYNPVGLASMLASAVISIMVFFGTFGTAAQPYSPIVALVIAAVFPPVLAYATSGQFYLRRSDDGVGLPMCDEDGNPSGAELLCEVCALMVERPDVTASNFTEGGFCCSLCLTTDREKLHVLPASPPSSSSSSDGGVHPGYEEVPGVSVAIAEEQNVVLDDSDQRPSAARSDFSQ
eukprot:gnl/Spiro4/5757_TR2947_c0_g1_i1.p1 gnl/Spiro4/5757_TR2947_c0_g1~~gnl/Spiro4/5757_TR2947_c0_g1_i1.p1  ORF type:complete len:647 (+),score=161.26 gnl/Spiro4/5757_TR2947_c0_g1_i1:62-2002(+)